MNKEHRNKILAIWRKKNRDKIKKQHNDWYLKHKNDLDLKLKRAKWNKDWNLRNKDNRLKWHREWRIKNIEKVKKNKLKWYKNNPEKVRKMRINELNTVGARISAYMRTRVRLAVISQKTWKRGKTIELLGCSIEQLKKHLSLNFKEGMSWDNYGHWHIDHIRPLSSFDLSIEEEQKKAFHYSNLQPLWASENLKKGKKYDIPTY